MDTNKIKLVRIESVLERVPYKRSSIYKKIQEDKFPKPRVQQRGFTAWRESDIDLYLQYLENGNEDQKWSEFIENLQKK